MKPSVETVKGFPSFPVVEREDNKVDWWKTIADLLEIIERHKTPARKFWAELSDEKRGEIISSYLPIEKDRNKKKRIKIIQRSLPEDNWETCYYI